jgi:Cof subfamily protein (haloacid dehalogenase superfamily)
MSRPGLPKLIATDLDGTLVRSDETVSAYTHEVLERVRAAGIPVVGATGRGPRLLDLTRRDIPAAGYLVLAGGGRVVDLTDPGAPAILAERRLDGAMVARLIDDLEAVVGPLTVMVEVLDGPYAPLWGELDPSWPWPQRVASMPRDEALAGEAIKAFVRADGMDVDGLLQVAQQVVPPTVASVTQAGLGFVEVCPPGVDKATGLAVVAESLGVDPADVLVFGDMPNDLPMFTWAGWGRVAVANAHPSVRALADEVTLSNDEDGVAVWLDRLLSGAR